MNLRFFTVFTLCLAFTSANPAFSKDGDRLSPDKSLELLGDQGPAPGEYVLVNAQTKMCLGKNIVKESGKEILLTMNCNEAAVKSGNYKELLAIVPNYLKGFNIRNAKVGDVGIDKGKYGKCATFDAKSIETTPLSWGDCSNQKTDAAFKPEAAKNQSFDIVFLSNNQWEIHANTDYCLDLMHSDGGNSEVVPKYCNYEASQHWLIVYAGALKEGPTKSAIMANGYVNDANGVLVRARIMNGAIFTSQTKTQTTAASDKACRDLCVKDKTCFSFSFYPKNAQGKNICEIHTSLSSAVQQTGAYSGRVFRPIAPCDMNDWKKCLK